jgi:PAS domain S-box-containing protein
MITILLIDDEIGLLEVAQLFLERDGDIRVIPALSAQQGLDLLGTRQFDAIVCDYDMPGMNGIDLLKTLRSRDNMIPIIIFTGKGNESVVIEALNNGADFYLRKGDDPREKFAELMQRIHDAVIRRQTREIIAESEKKYRALMEYAPVAIVSTDRSGHISDNNSMLLGLLGIESDGEVRKINLIHYPPLVKAGISADFEHCLNYGEGGTFEHYYVNERGKKIYLRYRIRPVLDAKKNITGLLAALEDFTEWKAMEESLKQANKKLRLLSSVTRHDILNQLTILIGNLELMKNDRMDESMRDYIRKEEQAAERIRNQIRFNKDYQDIGVHSPQWQNLKSTINKALMTINLGKISLKIDLPDIDVYANPLFEKVFFNLVNNSARSGEHVSAISISARQDESGITILYEDDGTGVEKYEKELIFERDYGKLVGYGLFVSREILSITDITIRETGEPDKGVRFEIFVPKDRYRMVAGKGKPSR